VLPYRNLLQAACADLDVLLNSAISLVLEGIMGQSWQSPLPEATVKARNTKKKKSHADDGDVGDGDRT